MPEKKRRQCEASKICVDDYIFARRCGCAYAQVWGFFMSSTTKEKKRHKLKCIVDVEGFARLIHTYPILPPPGYHNLRLWVSDACKHMHFHAVAVDPYSGNRSEIFIAAESCLPAMPRLQKGHLSLDTNFERYLQFSVFFNAGDADNNLDKTCVFVIIPHRTGSC